MGSSPGMGRYPEGGHGNPLQYSCLENSTDRGGWWATVRVTESAITELTVLLNSFFLIMFATQDCLSQETGDEL